MELVVPPRCKPSEFILAHSLLLVSLNETLELLSIKEKQFVGSGNYEREYNLGTGLVSTEEFGKITGVGTKQYISLLLKRGTTPSSNYDKTQGGDGVHKPEGRRKKGVHFIECLNNHGFLKGVCFGLKRIIKCHPIKFLGGGEGFDPVKKEMKDNK